MLALIHIPTPYRKWILKATQCDLDTDPAHVTKTNPSQRNAAAAPQGNVFMSVTNLAGVVSIVEFWHSLFLCTDNNVFSHLD